MTRVVVPDGAGFLGSRLCERLLCDDCEVLALDDLVTGDPGSVDDLVDGIVRLLRSNHPGPVDIGNPVEMPVLELAELFRDMPRSTPAGGMHSGPAPAPVSRQARDGRRAGATVDTEREARSSCLPHPRGRSAVTLG